MGSTVMNCSFLAVIAFLVCGTSAGIGQFTNCGSVPFNITWSPEPISPSHPLKIFYQYAFPHTMDGGKYDVAIWFHGDEDPFLEFADGFDCIDVIKYFPCPIKKGLKMKGSHVFEHIPNIGSYPGNYDVRLNITTRNDEPMICLQGHIIILKN